MNLKHLALPLLAATAVCSTWPSVAYAHPEHYAQSAYLHIEPDGVKIELDLSPGKKVAGELLRIIDTNNNTQLEDTEKRAYANAVLSDLSLLADGEQRSLAVDEVVVPTAINLRSGEDMLRVTLVAKVPGQEAGKHELVFQNKHSPVQSVHQAHAFTAKEETSIERIRRDPQSEDIRVTYNMKNAAAAKPTGVFSSLALGLLFVVTIAASFWQLKARKETPALTNQAS